MSDEIGMVSTCTKMGIFGSCYLIFYIVASIFVYCTQYKDNALLRLESGSKRNLNYNLADNNNLDGLNVTIIDS